MMSFMYPAGGIIKVTGMMSFVTVRESKASGFWECKQKCADPFQIETESCHKACFPAFCCLMQTNTKTERWVLSLDRKYCKTRLQKSTNLLRNCSYSRTKPQEAKITATILINDTDRIQRGQMTYVSPLS